MPNSLEVPGMPRRPSKPRGCPCIAATGRDDDGSYVHCSARDERIHGKLVQICCTDKHRTCPDYLVAKVEVNS